MIIDISEDKAVEAQLRINEERYRMLFTSMDQGLDLSIAQPLSFSINLKNLFPYILLQMFLQIVVNYLNLITNNTIFNIMLAINANLILFLTLITLLYCILRSTAPFLSSAVMGVLDILTTAIYTFQVVIDF